jgi:hypothetical protein
VSEKDARNLLPGDIFVLSLFPFCEIRLSEIAPAGIAKPAATSNPTIKER